MSKFRITKKHFTRPAVTVNAIHYFLYEGDIRRFDGDQISVSVAYFSRSRNKWLCDSHYIDEGFANELISYAIKRGLIDRQPDSMSVLQAA